MTKNWLTGRISSALDNATAMDFFAVTLECETEHGTYYVDRAAPDWTAKFRPKLSHMDERPIAIDAVDEGGLLDWPSRGCAVDACKLHAKLMGLGYNAHHAAFLVTERSRPPAAGGDTLPGLQPVAVSR